MKKILVSAGIGMGVVLAAGAAAASLPWTWEVILIVWMILDQGGDVGDFWWW